MSYLNAKFEENPCVGTDESTPLLFASQVLMKSKARSTALASAVKIDESSGIRCILLWLSDIAVLPTFESSYDP